MDEKLRQLVTEAEAGSADAQYALGCEYSQGKKVSKDEAKTVELFLKAGAQGHIQAQYWLGVFYANARSVPKDDAKAVEWYRRSAEQDYAPAQYNMGVHYATGRGVARDAKKACEWLTRASNTGYARAQNYLGWMYDNGYGVEKDEQTAVNLYRKAAEQGYAAAQCNLAESYYQGTGVAKDDTKAIEWFRKAAEQDYDDAQYYLGNAYATGRGLPKDDAKAAEWYRKAAAQGNTKAKEALAKLGIPEETPEDLREQHANQAIRQDPTGQAEEKTSPSNVDCRPLLTACTPQLYAENAFRLTGLAVHATARDIRRRQEDLKAVEGTSDWQDEHTHALSLDEHPTPEHVNAAFLKLQDPERRLIDELFWFWPLTPGHGNHDEALQLLKNGKDTEACQIWENTPRHRTHDGLAAMHNLAIYHHLLAIEQETRSQHRHSKQPAAEELKVIVAHWQKAMSYWETIVDEDAFWKLVTDRVRETNDPRLTTGFVRRLRATFPLAFDQINAILAATYAEASHFEHARRHVKYMEATQTGQDDIEKTIRTIFAPLEKRVNMLVEHAVADSRKRPEDGLKNAKHLLQATKEPLAVAKGLLDEGHTVRALLFDAVAEAAFSCLITYGNKTEDWQPCADLLTEVENLAVSKEARSRIRNNRDIARKNHEGKQLREQCWFCKGNKAIETATLHVAMYGDVETTWVGTGTRRTWRHLKVPVARCPACKTIHDHAPDGEIAGAVICAIAGLIIGGCAENVVTALIGGGIGVWAGRNIGKFFVNRDRAWRSTVEPHPDVLALRRQGWAFGEKPS